LQSWSDIKLVKAIQKGNHDAFDVIYKRHYDFVYFYCRRLIGTDDKNRLENLVQNIYIKVWGGISNFNVNHATVNFRGWLVKIAFRVVRDEIRKAKIHKGAKDGIIRREKNLHGIEGDPQQALIEKEKKDICGGALLGLPEITRLCVISCDVFGVPRKDVCKDMGLKLYQLDYHLKVGREALRKELKMYRPPGSKNNNQ
jgi:RNA polymerase sigma-70 factor (ECF subfamily)